jgi:hypothetical protein
MFLTLSSFFQLRRHGPQHDAGQADRRHLLAVRRASHRASGSGHRIKLFTHLPPKPKG